MNTHDPGTTKTHDSDILGQNDPKGRIMSETAKENLKAITDALKSVPEYEFEISVNDISAPPEITPEELKAFRESLGLSQTVFGNILGVSMRGVQEWEYGKAEISGTARRLLQLYSMCNPLMALSTKKVKSIKP